jgi:uncharacterized protein YegP (UPF0339 family)
MTAYPRGLRVDGPSIAAQVGRQSGAIQGMALPIPANEASGSPALARARPSGCYRFEIYRTGQLEPISKLFGAGDWYWCLTDQSGEIVADCGGYHTEQDCLAAVDALRAKAGMATVSRRP